jgi:hypothetical protein
LNASVLTALACRIQFHHRKPVKWSPVSGAREVPEGTASALADAGRASLAADRTSAVAAGTSACATKLSTRYLLKMQEVEGRASLAEERG